MTNDILLSVDDVAKHFGGVVALETVDLEIRENEILGLIGPNGAGKSTLLNVISSVHPVTKGEIRHRGSDITSLSIHEKTKRGIVRTFQESRHFGEMTGIENIHLADIDDKLFSRDMFISTLSKKEESKNVRQAIETIDLSRSQLRQTPVNMTHLERVQLAIARAIAKEPEIVMLDEPFAGLAAEEVDIVADLVKRMNQNGISVLLIDHNVGKVTAIADRVAVLHQGRILTEGKPNEILQDQEVRAAYLGE